jgi:hypothetical protein
MLVVTLHHIVADAWSMHLFAAEMSALYAAFANGLPSPLADLPLQYADYASRQQQMLQDGAYDEQVRYWERELSSARPLRIACAQLPEADPEAPGWLSLTVPLSLANALKEMAHRQNATFESLLIARFISTLQAFTSRQDLLVATPVAGRNGADTETLMGYFVKTLFVTTPVSGASTFRTLWSHLRRQMRDAHACRDVPVGDILDRALRAEDVGPDERVLTAAFALQNTATETWDLTNVCVEKHAIESKRCAFDIEASLVETADGLVGELRYNTALFDVPAMRRFEAEFMRLLAEVVVDGKATRPPAERFGGEWLCTG